MEEDIILSLVREARKDFPRMGSRKLLVYLDDKFSVLNIHPGRDRFMDLLYRNFMLVRRKRNKRKTTFSSHWMHKYPNLIRDYTPESPNRLWVSDITYIETVKGETAYLSLVTDACSHKIVGWNLARTLRACNALAALKMALKGHKGRHPELIHHSDRGSQYCCGEYVSLLARHGIRISMTESGDPLENAVAERVNGILKTEWLYADKPESLKNLPSYIDRIIDLYNNQRPHQSIGYMVPAVIHQTGQKTERKWKHYYRKGAETEGIGQGNSAPATPPLRSPAKSLIFDI
jgi:transposase InsO family protein